MGVFTDGDFQDHEQVVFVRDPATGLRAIIAVHSTARGPACGGCRMWPYATEEEALRDALRLSAGMTLKAAVMGLPFGGGKSVIIGDPARDKTPELLHAMGRAVHGLGGRYLTADDVGTTVGDMAVIRQVTPYARGLAGADGAPCPATAWGVYQGMLAAVEHAFGSPDLAGRTVAVQGLGSVGLRLCGFLHAAGAKLLVGDIEPARVEAACRRFGATAVEPGAILGTEADVLSPNALGAVLDDRSIQHIRARVVCGAANNQLAESRHGEALHRRGILYAPDFVVNAGGLIDVAHEGTGYDPAAVLRDCERIRRIAAEVFQRAAREGRPTAVVALDMAAAALPARPVGPRLAA